MTCGTGGAYAGLYGSSSTITVNGGQLTAMGHTASISGCPTINGTVQAYAAQTDTEPCEYEYSGGYYKVKDTTNYVKKMVITPAAPDLPTGTDFFIGGVGFALPTDSRVYNVPNTASDDITDGITHTFVKTAENTYTLTLNGGTISNKSDSGIRFAMNANVNLTICVAADTTVSSTYEYGICTPIHSLTITGDKTLTVTGVRNAIEAYDKLDLTGFTGILKTAQASTTSENTIYTGTLILPEAYRYKVNNVDTEVPATYTDMPYSYSDSADTYYLEFNCNPLPTATGATVALDSAFTLNVWADDEEFKAGGAFDGYTPSLEIENGATITTYTTDATTGNFIFTAQSFAAKNLGDTIKVRVAAAKSGEDTVYGAWKTISIADYLKTIVSDTTGAYTVKAKTLATDILNYGAAAQTHFEYNIENLVNNGVAQTNASTLDAAGILAALTGNVTDTTLPTGFTYEGTSLLLENMVKIRHYATYSGATVPSDASGNKLFGTVTKYYYETVGLTPLQFNDVQTVSVEGSPVTSFCVNDYINRVLSADTTSNLANLMVALYRYGASAEAYAAPVIIHATSANDIINNVTTNTITQEQAIALATAAIAANPSAFHADKIESFFYAFSSQKYLRVYHYANSNGWSYTEIPTDMLNDTNFINFSTEYVCYFEEN